MKKLMDAFAYAGNGIGHAFKTERNFRIEIFCAAAICIAGFAFEISDTAWLIILINIGIVLSAELFNTAIEKLCNAFTTEFNPAIKTIKDASAAAVLVSAVVAAVCGGLIFIPAILHFIKTN